MVPSGVLLRQADFRQPVLILVGFHAWLLLLSQHLLHLGHCVQLALLPLLWLVLRLFALEEYLLMTGLSESMNLAVRAAFNDNLEFVRG